jgi:predicted RNA-binding protein
MMFQNLQLPDCRAINGSLNATDFNISKKEVIEMRRKQLEGYLRELVESDCVRNSRILQKFLKINK